MSDAELKHRAQCSAIRITLSPHEWTWTQSEQEEMATLILMQNGEIEKLRKVAEAANGYIEARGTGREDCWGEMMWTALKEAGFGDE